MLDWNRIRQVALAGSMALLLIMTVVDTVRRPGPRRPSEIWGSLSPPTWVALVVFFALVVLAGAPGL